MLDQGRFKRMVGPVQIIILRPPTSFKRNQLKIWYQYIIYLYKQMKKDGKRLEIYNLKSS
jgi:hypothetical protein